MQQQSQQSAPSNRWRTAQEPWPVAPRYEIGDVAAEREEASRQLGRWGWQLGFEPMPDLERDGLLVECDDPPTSEDEIEAPYYSVYEPLSVPGLPGEIAGLQQGDRSAVLQFAHSRGLLGYGCLKGPVQEPLEPEPLAWIWAHAETVRRVLKLTMLLRDRESSLGAYLASIAEPTPEAGSAFASEWERFSPVYPTDRVTNLFFRHAQGRDPAQYAHWEIEGAGRFVDRLTSQESRAIAWHVVGRSINANLETVSPQLLGYGKPGYRYPALITAVYINLYDVAAGRTEYGQCQHCGRFFSLPGERSGPKQRYCSRSDGTTGDSYCSIRARKARWNRKRRNKGDSDGQAG